MSLRLIDNQVLMDVIAKGRPWTTLTTVSNSDAGVYRHIELNIVKGIIMSSLRILIYHSQDQRETRTSRLLSMVASLSQALEDCSILILTDLASLNRSKIPAKVDYIHLPAINPEHSTYSPTTGLNIEHADLRKLRGEIAQGALKTFRPDLVLFDDDMLDFCHVREIEKLAAYITGELSRTKIVWGLSDTLGEPEFVIAQWAATGALRLFDRYADELLVFGAREIFDLAQAYQMPERVARKLIYTGYLTCRTAPRRIGGKARPTNRRRPVILLALEGGTESFGLIDTYLQSLERRGSALPIRSLIVAGPGLRSHQKRELAWRAQRLGNVYFHRDGEQLLHYARRADLIICEAKYEVMSEILPHCKMAMVMPNANQRSKHSFRARLLQAHGLVTMMPDDGHPTAMRRRILKMLAREAPAMKRSLLGSMILDGFAKTAERVQHITGYRQAEENFISARAA